MTLQIHMPAYNEERHIEGAIATIINQTFRDWRLTVHDNASADRTAEICEAIARLDSRVTVNRARHNAGAVGQGGRTGCHYDSEFVSFRSANDLLHPDYYAATMDLIQATPDCATAYSYGYEFQDSESAAWPLKDDYRIDTRGMTPVESCAEVMSRYAAPFPLWGVHRRRAHEMCRRYQYTYGGDHVFVAELALYGAIAPTAERLDYRRVSAGEEDLMHGHVLHQSEEFAREVTPRAVLDSVKQYLAFTDMAYAHLEMLSLALIDDSAKLTLMAHAVKVFMSRFGDTIREEATRLPQLLAAAEKSLSKAGTKHRLFVMLYAQKARHEVHKCRTLQSATPEQLAECEEAIARIMRSAA